MTDRRFFTAAGPFTLSELAALSGAEIGGAGDRDLVLRDVAPLETAGASDVSFLDNRKYVTQFRNSRAGAAFVHRDLAGQAPEGMSLLLSDQPYRAYALAAQAFYPEPPLRPGVAASAVVDPSARLGEGCEIAAHAVIGKGAEIGPDTLIGANAVIGDGVVIGPGGRIGANVTISHSLIGARVTIFPGASIGQDGFGFAPDPTGHVRIPQLGRVVIGDDVVIGANTAIDRGAGPDTVIGEGTMIDNLVQIGHNIVIGRHCAIAAQVGMSGSTKLGDFVMMGGQGGLAGHLTIGKGARIAGQSGVISDVPPGATVCGFPALPAKEFWRGVAMVQRLARKKGE
ncbi:MAG: UDP-3-O-(3-hydroxymyristoyl)glucosamine N-acyltransferase [Alphaproteobacteria bacterium]|nr:UDP-3-O-(3-hydroxymyristoyl)glucosamine N-acyltransferase [Alphaproteobacteria bacterium]